jgi:polysaccharide biosynthesis transport protein
MQVSPIQVIPPAHDPWTRPDTRYLTGAVSTPPAEPVLSFGYYLSLLRRRWLRITATVVTCTAVAALIATRLTPVYESTARIAIDPETPSTVVGDPAVSGGASDIDQMFNTEVQLVQSDSVLRPVADQFHLIGSTASQKVPTGMSAADAPVFLKNLTVTHPANSFLITIGYRSTNPVEAAGVANAIALSYIMRGMETRSHAAMDNSAFMEKQIAQLKQNMDDSATALDGYEKRLGVIDPEGKTSILQARLLQLNTQYTDAQNDRIRTEVERRALESGSPAAIEVSAQGTALATMQTALNTAQEKMAAAKTIYGPNNAEYKRAKDDLDEVTRQYEASRAEVGKRIEVQHEEASNRENMLQAALLEAKSESDALHTQSLEYEEKKREAETNKSLYDELFRKVKEASINGAFQGGAIRITDKALPQLHPVFPNKTVFVALGFLFSLASSIIVVLVADLLDKSLRDPRHAQQVLGVEILGTLPHIRKFHTISTSSLLRLESKKDAPKGPSGWFASAEFYEEAIHTLLSSITLSRRGNPVRTILITSATPGEGKSSCAAHMAAAHARQGYRTLLIDADLRRPSQQGNFDLPSSPGLADGILNDKGLSEIRLEVAGYETLDVIPAGISTRRNFRGVGKKVGEILSDARDKYDLIFIDAPPMLCFAEPLQLARLVDGVLVVSQAGRASAESVNRVLDTLRRLGAPTLGVVLNRMQPHHMSSDYRSYESYYRPRIA